MQRQGRRRQETKAIASNDVDTVYTTTSHYNHVNNIRSFTVAGGEEEGGQNVRYFTPLRLLLYFLALLRPFVASLAPLSTFSIPAGTFQRIDCAVSRAILASVERLFCLVGASRSRRLLPLPSRLGSYFGRLRSPLLACAHVGVGNVSSDFGAWFSWPLPPPSPSHRGLHSVAVDVWVSQNHVRPPAGHSFQSVSIPASPADPSSLHPSAVLTKQPLSNQPSCIGTRAP